MGSKGSLKKTIEPMEHAHTSLRPTVSALGYFLCALLDYWGCLVRCETYFVKFWVNFDQNNVKEGRPKFEKLKVRGSI